MPIVEDFHGTNFDSPVQRMKEYVEIIRMTLLKNKLIIQEKIFQLKNFTLLIGKPKENQFQFILQQLMKKWLI